MTETQPQTTTEIQARAALQAAIEGLYSTFPLYPLRERVEGCPCCISPEDEALLHSKPLPELTLDDLERSAFKALTTWGDADDFRHFLPRLLELFAFEGSGFTLPEALIGKLEYSSWRSWPGAEQAAINAYFTALWPYELECCPCSGRCEWRAEECLFCIAQVVDDLRPYLKVWQNLDIMSARYHLAAFAGCSYEMGPEDLLDGSWRSRPAQREQVIRWLFEPATLETLQRAVPHAPGELLPELTEALGRLSRWQARRRAERGRQ